ncbi:TetR/AcrR family transcriptional regulator [Rhodococcoides kyotonense]|uniref:DNA-binding transcriptional regulator, AcrR family n=1 Tax=Rhodococcoides kyotonense TaxID=398843 RepID=A0A239I2C4_9NOCA|nr:TetR/AcrR family transcriptional regulator [Rhodococcus kyotonensis]SNS87532.1 DNA-binding transcriptional regulator, AcrR family [Rhodococcus kyotonensis]
MPRRRTTEHEGVSPDESDQDDSPSTGCDSSPAADDDDMDYDAAAHPVRDTETKGSAHRPSRRHLIVQAAVRVFSKKGFAEASIQEIAEAAGMVATAVYYHFSSKEELFESALGYAMDASSAAAQNTRPDDVEADATSFRAVIGAVWDWTAEHPNASRMLFLQIAGGATSGTRLLTKEYMERHIRRAFDYFPATDVPPNKRAAAAQQAARSLRVRTMIATTIAIQPLRIEGGPLSNISVPRLRTATSDVCSKMIEGR